MAFSSTAMELYLGQRELCLVEQLIILAKVGFMKSKDFPTFTKQPHNSNIVVRPYVKAECALRLSASHNQPANSTFDVCKGCCAISADL